MGHEKASTSLTYDNFESPLKSSKINCQYSTNSFSNLYLGSVINYGAKMVNVGCSSSQYMVIKSANYGDFNQNGVFNEDKNVSTVCSAATTCRVKSRCNGKKSCELIIDNSLLPSQHCLNSSEEVYIKYTCGDTNNSPLSTEGNPCYD